MIISRTEFDEFVAHAQLLVPNFTVVDGKRDSYLMNLIDGLIWPFTPKFMSNFVTTIVGRAYFPAGMIDKDPTSALEVASHEFVHAYDVKRLTAPLFIALYLGTLLLLVAAVVACGLLVSWAAFLPLAALGIHAVAVALYRPARRATGLPLLAFSLVGAVGLSFAWQGAMAWWLAASLVFVLPLPAPGRYWAEMRGYGMSLYAEYFLFGRMWIHEKIGYFTGSAYYWMWPFPSRVDAKLYKHAVNARMERFDDPAFLHVQKFFRALKARRTQETTA